MPTLETLVVRLIRTPLGAAEFRGHVEHVRFGRHTTFRSAQDLISALQAPSPAGA
jgi:hypothetical protein